MSVARKQRWQQATALVSLSTAGAMTGIAFAHGTVADMTSPTSMPAHLLAFKQAARPVSVGDGALRSAIVSAAKYYLRLAQGRTPAEMEALIWQNASADGADHGASCAAFASLTLEAGAQASGQQSWVTGGSSYPWPLHGWADVRVDPNPQSPGIVSILQDGEAHHRWHALGDGYTPRPGDWVLFAGHVEVVTQYSGGVLSTIGGDSMPNLSVNAHQYDDPLSAQGVAGFVNNGELLGAQTPATAPGASASSDANAQAAAPRGQGQADIPGSAVPAISAIADGSAPQVAPSAPADPAPGAPLVMLGTAAIPGAQPTTGGRSASHHYGRNQVTATPAQAADTSARQSFIQEIAPGAVAAQRQYGVPAAVTIAQAIDESGWGQSQLAAQDNNLFGIKGTGPAGSVLMPTQEYENGQWVTVDAPFRVYNSVAESINDHGLLLATGSSYKQAMANRADPDAFANDLTGVYATDPNYGANLITIMRLYNLYRYGAGSHAAPATSAPVGSALGQAARNDTSQNGPGANSGASGNAAQGLAGYGPALGAASGRAAQGVAGYGPALGAASGGAAQGVAGYGPALGGAGGGAASTALGGAVRGNQALQSMSSLAAAIPGTAGPSAEGRGGASRLGLDGGAATGRATGHRAASSRSSDAEASERHSVVGASSDRRSLARNRTSGAALRQTAAGRTGHSGSGGSGLGTAGVRGAQSAAATGAASGGAARPSGTSGRTARASGTAVASASGGSLGGVSGGAASASGTAVAGASGAPLGGVRGAPLGGARIPGAPSGDANSARRAGAGPSITAGPRNARISTRRYVPRMPQAVTTAFITTAKTPLLRSEPLYRDVASETGVRWQLLAACDWMQCRAQPRVSPVYGEKLGTKNPDGTVYRTKSEALKQCARDMIVLASAVYGIELTAPLHLSVRDLARVFAAFRWGGLLAEHDISALEFPYSVEGLTGHHLKMRWPDVPEAPGSDKPGTRFAMPFGAVPVVLGLDYRAVA